MVKYAGKDKQRPWVLVRTRPTRAPQEDTGTTRPQDCWARGTGPQTAGYYHSVTGPEIGPGTKGLPQGHWAREYWARGTRQRHETTRPENWTRAPMRYWAHRAAGPGRHSTTVVPHCYNYTARLVTYTWQR